MAVIAGLALVDVSGNLLMVTVGLTLTVLMAQNALEDRVAGGLHVTFRALSPPASMGARVDREERIVIPG
jgi:hypothetical protein